MQHADQLTLGVDDLDGSSVVALKEVEQPPRDRPFKAPANVTIAFPLGPASGGVGAGVQIVAQPCEHDGVQGVVGLAVAAAVDSLGRLRCQTGAWLLLTMMGGASRLAVGKVASCPASRCDLPCALSAL